MIIATALVLGARQIKPIPFILPVTCSGNVFITDIVNIRARTAFPCTSGPIKLWQSTHHALVVCLINNVSRQFQEIGCWLVWSKVSVSRVSYHGEQTASLMGYRLGPCFCNHELSILHHALLSACMRVCVWFLIYDCVRQRIILMLWKHTLL